MTRPYDFKAQRLYVAADLAAGATITCDRDQANYLRNVLRLRDGATINLFNGRDGEWRAGLTLSGRKGCTLEVAERLRAQQSGPDIDYLFAPLKRARLDYMVQKAVEMGVARLRPVITRFTQVERVNLERMRANAIEAAEQCGVLQVPDVASPLPLEKVLADWDLKRQLIHCDEDAERANPIEALLPLREKSQCARPPLAVLIGPEGGFSAEERALLAGADFVTSLSLGPRIMRADTAAVAALALVNGVIGDWR